MEPQQFVKKDMHVKVVLMQKQSVIQACTRQRALYPALVVRQVRLRQLQDQTSANHVMKMNIKTTPKRLLANQLSQDIINLAPQHRSYVQQEKQVLVAARNAATVLLAGRQGLQVRLCVKSVVLVTRQGKEALDAYPAMPACSWVWVNRRVVTAFQDSIERIKRDQIKVKRRMVSPSQIRRNALIVPQDGRPKGAASDVKLVERVHLATVVNRVQ